MFQPTLQRNEKQNAERDRLPLAVCDELIAGSIATIE
jgi:hypothetical protein